MAKKFLNPKGAKNIVPALIRGTERGVGTVAAAYAINNFNKTKGKDKDGNEVMKDLVPRKVAGAIAFGLGVLGEAFVDQEDTRAVLQGIGNYGFLHAVGENLTSAKPDSKFTKAHLGLSGSTEEETGTSGAGEGGSSAIDWASVAANAAAAVEAEKAAEAVNGAGEDGEEMGRLRNMRNRPAVDASTVDFELRQNLN